MFNNTARRNTSSVNNYNILLYMTTYHWKHYRQKYTTKKTQAPLFYPKHHMYLHKIYQTKWYRKKTLIINMLKLEN